MKSREFWIQLYEETESGSEIDVAYPNKECIMENGEDIIHVIEKSAYYELQVKLDERDYQLRVFNLELITLRNQCEKLAAAMRCFKYEEVGLADIQDGKQALAEYEEWKTRSARTENI